jgi:hypothetical protein
MFLDGIINQPSVYTILHCCCLGQILCILTSLSKSCSVGCLSAGPIYHYNNYNHYHNNNNNIIIIIIIIISLSLSLIIIIIS